MVRKAASVGKSAKPFARMEPLKTIMLSNVTRVTFRMRSVVF